MISTFHFTLALLLPFHMFVDFFYVRCVLQSTVISSQQEEEIQTAEVEVNSSD